MQSFLYYFFCSSEIRRTIIPVHLFSTRESVFFLFIFVVVIVVRNEKERCIARNFQFSLKINTNNSVRKILTQIFSVMRSIRKMHTQSLKLLIKNSISIASYSHHSNDKRLNTDNEIKRNKIKTKRNEKKNYSYCNF